MSRLLLTVLFLEIGFVLVVVPWSSFWERNYFAQSIPFLRTVLENNYVRGAVSGLGLVNLGAGLVELFSLCMSRPSQSSRPTSISSRAAED